MIRGLQCNYVDVFTHMIGLVTLLCSIPINGVWLGSWLVFGSTLGAVGFATLDVVVGVVGLIFKFGPSGSTPEFVTPPLSFVPGLGLGGVTADDVLLDVSTQMTSMRPGAIRYKTRYAWVYGDTQPGPWFNIKMSSYQYRKSHCGNKTVARSSYLQNGIS